MVQLQSFQDWELIIVDDGSTDNTWEILQNLVSDQFSVFAYQRPTNKPKGPSSCRNLGVEKSNGEYIAFLDADDEWSISRLQNAYGFLKDTKAKAVYSGAWVVDRKGKYFRSSRPIKAHESLFDFVINGNSFSQTSTLITKTDIARHVGFPENIRFHEDFDYFMNIGELESWQYFPADDVIVHWEDNHLKNVDHLDCLWFYNKHRHLSRDKKARLDYLKYMAHELALRNPRARELKEYSRLLKKELKKIGLHYWFLFSFPVCYYFLWKLRS